MAATDVNTRAGIQLNNWQRELDFRTPAWEKLDAALAQLVEAGYGGAEVPNWSVPDLKEPQRLRDLCAQRGVTLISLHCGGVFYDAATYREQTLPKLRPIAEYAAAAGAQALVVSTASKRFDGGPAGLSSRNVPEWKTQAECAADFGRMLRDLGLGMWVHNHAPQFQHDALEMDQLLEADASLVGLCVDVGHAAQSMAQDKLQAWLARHWNRVGCLHYKDIDAAGQLVEALGDGVIDFGAISCLARERRSPEWIVAELDPGRGGSAARPPLEDARRSSRLIQRTLGA